MRRNAPFGPFRNSARRCASRSPRARQNFARSLAMRRGRAIRSRSLPALPRSTLLAGLPVGIDIPGFIEKIGQKDFRSAYDVITATNLLPAVCGRVCPQESNVKASARSARRWSRGDRRLERFVGDRAMAEVDHLPYIEHNGFKVGIVGSVPAGMAWPPTWPRPAATLRYTKRFTSCGVLKYGIPISVSPTVVDAESATSPSSASSSNATRWSAPVHDRANDRQMASRGLHRTGRANPALLAFPATR